MKKKETKKLEGEIVGFTAKPGNIVELVIAVSGHYDDFKLNEKFELKKK